MRFPAALLALCLLPVREALLDGNGMVDCIPAKDWKTMVDAGINPETQGKDKCKIYKGTTNSCPCPCGCAHYKAWDRKGTPNYDTQEVRKCEIACGVPFDAKAGCWNKQECNKKRAKVRAGHGDPAVCPCCPTTTSVCEYG